MTNPEELVRVLDVFAEAAKDAAVRSLDEGRLRVTQMPYVSEVFTSRWSNPPIMERVFPQTPNRPVAA